MRRRRRRRQRIQRKAEVDVDIITNAAAGVGGEIVAGEEEVIEVEVIAGVILEAVVRGEVVPVVQEAVEEETTPVMERKQQRHRVANKSCRIIMSMRKTLFRIALLVIIYLSLLVLKEENV